MNRRKIRPGEEEEIVAVAAGARAGRERAEQGKLRPRERRKRMNGRKKNATRGEERA